MALPYPGMDFTSLDILTAADMDKLVANIEYLATQSNVRTVSDQSGTRKAIYFGDGTLITTRYVQGQTACSTQRGNVYSGNIPEGTDYWVLVPAGETDFIAKPVVSVTAVARGQYYWLGGNENGDVVSNSSTGNRWAIPSGAYSIFRGASHNSVGWLVNVIGVGRWKN